MEFTDQVLDGCRLTIAPDSCHSGGLIEEGAFRTKREDGGVTNGGRV